jgi:ATP/maltotriose-dependent transcriptional regulator MalT
MHDTTRAYLREKLTESEDLAATRHSHAAFYRQFLEGVRSRLLVFPAEAGQSTYREHLADVLAALEYCFSGHGDADIATALAAAAAPLLFRLSLLNECRHWTERAMAKLDDRQRGTGWEMELQTAFGLSLMLLGHTDTSEATFARGLAIAEAIGDGYYQVWLLVALHLARMIAGDVHGAMSYARACQAVAIALDDPSSIAVADWILGASCHIAGDQSGAERHCRTALAPLPESTHTIILRFGFDVRFPALCALARCLWLRGQPDQAVRLAHDIVADAETTEHPVTVCFALAWTVYIFFWSGNLAGAERLIERLQRHAEQHALAPYGAVALGLRGELWVRRGDVGAGLRQLQAWSDTSHADRFRVHDTAFASRNGAAFCLPELLRVKGDVIAAMPDGDLRTAEDCYLQALETAGQQSAPAWELRTAISLTRLLIRQDRAPDALRMLLPLYQRFSEGLESFDLQAAKALLDRLASPHSPGDTAGSQPLPRQTSWS